MIVLDLKKLQMAQIMWKMIDTWEINANHENSSLFSKFKWNYDEKNRLHFKTENIT